MLYNNDFVCIIVLPVEKLRFPHTFSLFFPHDFEIVCFDAFISFMIFHCTFKCVKSYFIISMESFVIHQATSLTFVINNFLYGNWCPTVAIK